MQQSELNIEDLYNQYSQRLFFTSLRIVGDTCDAQEIMHDTFLKYYTYPQKGEIKELPKWLSSICIRKSIDMLRSKNRYKQLFEDYKDTDNGISTQIDSSFMLDENDEPNVIITNIKNTLNSLPDKYRIIISLHLLEGYDYAEIEQITGIKEAYIRSLYMRGKTKLAEALKCNIK